ncbi:MAG: DEAD/DEAH box helicase, partial [Promethearchaeota archaeon]
MTINSKISDLKKEKDENFEVQKFISEKKIVRALNEARIYKLRRIQKEAIKKGLFFRKSFLVCAPSGSGKTLVGELGAIYNIIQGLGKSIYLVPFKALATEKYNHFKKIYGILNIKIELSIGDQEPDEKQLQYSDLI